MPSIVTAAQLRSVLGVSESLYNDAYLNEIINTSEAVILPMLVANTSAVNAYKLTSNVATYYTARAHHFVTGQSIVVAGLPAPFTATVTVVDANSSLDAMMGNYYFTAAITNADVIASGEILVAMYGYGAIATKIGAGAFGVNKT
jgi:hypothetical protein